MQVDDGVADETTHFVRPGGRWLFRVRVAASGACECAGTDMRGAALEGAVSAAQALERARDAFGVSVVEYAQRMRAAIERHKLQTPDEGAWTLRLEDAGGSSSRLLWRSDGGAGQWLQQSVVLRAATDTDSLADELIGELLCDRDSAAELAKVRMGDIARLKEERRTLIAQAEGRQTNEERDRDEMMQKFALLLNSKKRQIIELQQRLAQATARAGGGTGGGDDGEDDEEMDVGAETEDDEEREERYAPPVRVKSEHDAVVKVEHGAADAAKAAAAKAAAEDEEDDLLMLQDSLGDDEHKPVICGRPK